MRIVISDYSGHPFQVQLSRALARRGHNVLHVTSESFQTPKGRLAREADDPATFATVGVRLDAPFAKDSFFKRRRQEIAVGDLIAEQIARFRPDVVVSSNAPLDTQRRIQQAARAARAGFVFWVQDLYGEAILRILSARLGLVGQAIGRFYRALESRMIRLSDHAVVIVADFVPIVTRLAKIPADRLSVIENWAPLDEIPNLARDVLPDSALRFVYSGTLGFKHNPDLLLRLAERAIGEVYVYSEGAAAERLAADAQAAGLGNLHVSGWVRFEDLPATLARADVLVVILEPDAGIFSVPSKVLTYLCVGRPILGAIPAENLAARLIAQNDAGIAVDPTDDIAFVAAAAALAEDPDARFRQGKAARAYAEQAFDIEAIATRFETILADISSRKAMSTS